MPRSLVLGNGNILVCLDKYGQVRDLYFPHVGLENHVTGHSNYVHRIGVWVDHQLRWTGDGSWDIHIDCARETLASHIEARNEALGVTLTFHDAVYNEKNIFLRRIIVRNLRDQKRQAKLFFHQQFEIMESHRGDTGYYDPQYNTVVHLKGRRVFLINAKVGDRAFDDYSIGIFGREGREGTYKDAEGGVLSKNRVEHGKVDSVIGLTLELTASGAETVYYWISMGKSMRETSELNKYVQEKSPQYLMKTTEDFWTAWVNRQNIAFADLDTAVVELFKKSLFIIRAHVDANGSILASGDSDMLQYGRDTYSYMWPRDGAQSAIALDKAGDANVAKSFFIFFAI
jgi:GH15 family glucan-1,4-alpha-glucosidase